MSEWLVRTAENQIAGPYTAQQVREFIAEEKINRHDEICQANAYWIYLHEGDELWDQLNVRLPRGGEDSEITQTEDISLPEFPELNEQALDEEDIEERTLLLRNRQIRQFHPRPQRSLGTLTRSTSLRGRTAVPVPAPVRTITPRTLKWIVLGLTLVLFGLGYVLLARFFVA